MKKYPFEVLRTRLFWILLTGGAIKSIAGFWAYTILEISAVVVVCIGIFAVFIGAASLMIRKYLKRSQPSPNPPESSDPRF